MQLFNLHYSPPRFVHPRRDALACAQHERTAEGAVSAEAALLGQLLGDDGLAGLGSLLTTADEIVDAQVVDIGVVGDALAGEILAQIRAVCADGRCQLRQGEVGLQVKLRVGAVLFQQLLNLVEVDADGRLATRPAL